MKITNINKLILKFIGGGIIKVPIKFLKNVDIESPDINNEITVDDITPELLQSKEIRRKIFNFGLSDDVINTLPLIVIDGFTGINGNNVNYVSSYTYLENANNVESYSISYNGNTFTWTQDSNDKETIRDIIANSEYILIKAGVNNIVFKKAENTRFYITFSVFRSKPFQTIRFSLLDNNFMRITQYAAGLSTINYDYLDD